ncbi:MAG: hypothetical protein IJZ25_03410 [Lachnospiraceae bacterium]|nr:hypothetical protein [Lachnospiraceae bacterium]
MEESSVYLNQKSVFFDINENDAASRIDRYADSILLNITYCYDENSPLKSVLSSSYYHSDSANENINLSTVVNAKGNGNTSYMRYWHGSTGLLRPLFTIFNIQQIYILNGIILTILAVILLYILWTDYGKGTAISFFISIMMCGMWYIPYSSEYTSTFMLMLIACILLSKFSKLQTTGIITFFLTIGSLTSYFDFLTTETVTLLVPLALMLIIKHRNNPNITRSSEIVLCFKCCVAWFAGYALTWISKWGIACLVLGPDNYISPLEQVAYRMQGDLGTINGIKLITTALLRNINCLFPFSLLGKYGFVWVLIFMLTLAMIYFLIKQHPQTSNIIPFLLIISIIPYIRYIALANHSYLHYFFTYRAQFATIFCICLIFLYGTDRHLLQKEWKKLWKKIPKKQTKKK